MPIVAAAAVPHPPIILPQVGHGEEAKIAATADAYYKAMTIIAQQQPQVLVLASPHADLYADGFLIAAGDGAKGDFSRFGAPGAKLAARYDQSLAAAIEATARAESLPALRIASRDATLDHGTAIPLWFWQAAAKPLPIVRLGLSGLPLDAHYSLGQCIAKAAGGRRAAFIASGDLSHRLKSDGPYGFAPEGPELDKQITAALASGNFGQLLNIDPALADAGSECGLRAFVMMAGALDGRRVSAELLSYQDTFGVGYAVATFLPGQPDTERRFLHNIQASWRAAGAEKRAREDAWVRLARSSVENWVRRRQHTSVPQGLPEELLNTRAGVFVSLHKRGALRGCIGTIAPTTPSTAEEILQNAISAATEDPRFPPLRPAEIDELEISVDVLGPPEAIASQDELDVQRYGVIVSSGGRRGLLLPALDGVDSVQEQVDIARRKAGIPEGAPLKLERFEVIRHE